MDPIFFEDPACELLITITILILMNKYFDLPWLNCT